MNFAMLTTAHGTQSFGTWLHAKNANTVRNTSPATLTRISAQEIAKNAILEVKQPYGVTIECMEGAVWVTLDGDSRDVVLDAGQSFTVDRNQRTLLQALEAARVRFIDPTHMQ
jgi:quercetin dioxygenase-like cupin family protein